MDRAVVQRKLGELTLGIPTWGLADSGTRFHVYKRPYSPRNLYERIDDAAQVHKYVGDAPMVDLHLAWDKPDKEDWAGIRQYAEDRGLKIGAVNPHLFNEDKYTLGSFSNPDKRVREESIRKHVDAVEIARQVGSTILSLWFADGTDYPGQDNLRKRNRYMYEGLKATFDALDPDMSMLVEYKFFEPNFYSMDLADWGTSFIMAQKLGERARVLVDLGHHALGTNIEQIVGVLLGEGKLGGFHFNDHRYADDDLTVGSVNPYQLFLIFCELVWAELDPTLDVSLDRIALMIDENHNFKNAIEGTIQSVEQLEIAYARALLVDYDFLHKAQDDGNVIDAEECLKDAYLSDVRPLIREAREAKGLDPEPIKAFRRSGYISRVTEERRDRTAATGSLGG